MKIEKKAVRAHPIYGDATPEQIAIAMRRDKNPEATGRKAALRRPGTRRQAVVGNELSVREALARRPER